MYLSKLRTRVSALSLALVLSSSCAKKDAGIQPGPDFQKRVQEALILAKPGAVIELPAGRHEMTTTLSLSVENVTIRGKGIDKTILSFQDQKNGSAGLLVNSGGLSLGYLA